MQNNSVAIIIVTYNASEYIGGLFSSLKNLRYPSGSFRVVVVDNRSQDKTVELVRSQFSWVHVIENIENVGFAEGNNIGIRFAQDLGLAFAYLLNQDTEVEPDFLEKAVAVMQRDETIGAVQSRLMLYGRKNTVNSIGNQIHYLGFGYAGGHQTSLETQHPQKTDYDIAYPSGAACLLRMDALKKIGFFQKELFMYHEDLDLGWRLWLSGHRCVLSWNSVVYHKYEFSRSVKKYYFMERNRLMVILQNYSLGTLVLIAPAFFITEIAMLFYSLFTGFWREKISSYGYFFKAKHWIHIFARRKSIQSNRWVSERQVVKRFTGIIEYQDMHNPLLRLIFNPLSRLYWSIIRFFIFW